MIITITITIVVIIIINYMADVIPPASLVRIIPSIIFTESCNMYLKSRTIREEILRWSILWFMHGQMLLVTCFYLLIHEFPGVLDCRKKSLNHVFGSDSPQSRGQDRSCCEVCGLKQRYPHHLRHGIIVFEMVRQKNTFQTRHILSLGGGDDSFSHSHWSGK